MGVAVGQAVLDDDTVRAWTVGALTACRAARERIDAVNVFPVPDADTGSNVALTVAGGADAVAQRDSDGSAALLAAFAHGAVRAARGNSGIIVSQWLVGLSSPSDAASVDTDPTSVLVAALERAADVARAAVPDPQEGTVLTVAREVAAHARRLAHGRAHPTADVLAAATGAARSDLARLSAGHDVLRAAQVVDAGACALLVLLDALVHTLRTGRAIAEGDLDLDWLPRAAPAAAAVCAPADGGAFEVMVLLRPTWPAVDDLARALQSVGDAVAVVDAGGSRHAHVHCDDPAAAVALVPPDAREQVVVRLVAEPAAGERGLVVLTRSPGLAAWYATCGAVTLVGPQVTTDQVVRAAVDTRAARVAVVTAGVDVVGPASGTVEVDLVPAPGDGHAVVACLALVADAALSPAAGRDAVHRLRSLVLDGPSGLPAAVAGLLDEVPGAQGATIVHGEDVDPVDARAAAAAVQAAHPQLEVVVAGPAAGPAWWVGVD